MRNALIISLVSCAFPTISIAQDYVGYTPYNPLIIDLTSEYYSMGTTSLDYLVSGDDSCNDERRYRPNEAPASPTDPDCCEDDPDCAVAPYSLYLFEGRLLRAPGNISYREEIGYFSLNDLDQVGEFSGGYIDLWEQSYGVNLVCISSERC